MLWSEKSGVVDNHLREDTWLKECGKEKNILASKTLENSSTASQLNSD